MKRTLVYLLIVIIVAGWLGTLIARDPGYVLISWEGKTLETGVWVGLAILIAIVAAAWYLARLVRLLLGSTSALQGWQANRKRDRAEDNTNKGLALLQAGEYQRAEKFLLDGAKRDKGTALNYISAARAADGRGDPERRDELLEQAVAADGSTMQAASVARAEMCTERGQWKEVLASLQNCDENQAVLRLKKRALFALKDWQGLMALMPKLRKIADDPTRALEFEKEVALARLSESLTKDARKVVFGRLQDLLKKDPDVIEAYVRHAGDEKDAEAVLRNAIKSNWNPRLVMAYGSLGKDSVPKRLKTAQRWLKQHPDDYALQYCLGELYRLNGEQWNARECYEKSLDLKPTPEACEQLAELLSMDGDHARSSQYFRQALKLGS